MRFGVIVSAPTRGSYLDAVARAEQLGYDVALCSDHLELGGRHSSHFTPIPALTAAAMATARLRIGTSVINQDLRHPALLARDAASLDVLSGGRLELGLGAGWAEREYTMAGMQFDPIGVRVRRFAEYVAVVKGVLAEPAFSFEGEFFKISGMPGEPAPAQAPIPPIMIGATGPKLLRLAAREADIVSINMLKAPEPTPAALAERVSWVREAAGKRFERLELQMTLAAVIPAKELPERALARRIADGDPFLARLAERIGVEGLAQSPLILVGDPQQMTERLLALTDDHGIGYVMVPMMFMEALGDVIPYTRGGQG